MTDDIRALLEELKEVEPLLWDKITYLDQGDRVIKFAYQVLDDFALDHLHGCIQRACETNKWYLQQTSEKEIHPSDGAKYRAQIKVKRDEYTDKNFWGKSADTPAAAILVAYVQAKRAMR